MACPLCRRRKGKRSCPAKAVAICAHCCGTKRLVEIDCPSDCVYLTGTHAGAWDGRESQTKREARRLALHLQDLSERELELFFLALMGVAGIRRTRKDLTDALLFQAVTALRGTLETLRAGILYEHQAEDLRAQGIVEELKELLAKEEDDGGQAPSAAEQLAVLRALETCGQAYAKETTGPTSFLDAAVRLTGGREGEASRRHGIILEP